MSGGRFDYNQYKIRDIAEHISSIVENNGRKKTEEELRNGWYYGDMRAYYENNPDELYFEKYDDDIIKIFREGVAFLRAAEVYAQRIDWFLSGDDGEDSLKKRLKQDLKALQEDNIFIEDDSDE